MPDESKNIGKVKPAETAELLLYKTDDNKTRIQVTMLDNTVWLTQLQMSELFQTTVPNINIHIRNIYEEKELTRDATIKDYLIVQQEGNRRVERVVEHYNLDIIISVGYRVRSLRGTQFRQWATAQLREYMIKGFVLDDERLKDPRRLGSDYFDELLERIRDIRTSERRFYQKITDIYATSIDYDQNSTETHEFFATVQNKLHWAIHKHTAAEVVASRSDHTKPNMGLTTWKSAPHGPIRKTDVDIAKNYLTVEEITLLNLMTDQYLSFAEFQAQQRKPMTMIDWRTRLDAFLKLNERDILSNAGGISSDVAKEMASAEFDKYKALKRRTEANEPTSDFDKVVDKVKKLSSPGSRKST